MAHWGDHLPSDSNSSHLSRLFPLRLCSKSQKVINPINPHAFSDYLGFIPHPAFRSQHVRVLLDINCPILSPIHVPISDWDISTTLQSNLNIHLNVYNIYLYDVFRSPASPRAFSDRSLGSGKILPYNYLHRSQRPIELDSYYRPW